MPLLLLWSRGWARRFIKVAQVGGLVLVGSLLLMELTPSVADPQQVPRLAVSTPFAAPGGSLVFSVAGTPGAKVKLVVATQPAEIKAGASGLQFYQTGTQTDLAAGTIPAGGSFSATVAVPASATLGQVFYVQASAKLGGTLLLSNAVAYRVQAAPPQGARRTAAIAATPDGSRAYVADQLSGVITVLDAQRDARLAELPVTQPTGNVPHRPLHLAVDPEGRHAFLSNVSAGTLTVLHTATGSVAAQIPVPRGSRGIGFDFRDGNRRIYVANETQNAVLVFKEAPLGTFTAKASIPLQGTAPGPLLVLPDGRLAVGTRTGNQIEILDPTAPAGATTVAATTIPGTPHDLAWSGSEILIPTFIVFNQNRVPGFNRVLRMDPTSFEVTGYLLDNLGTDYRSMAVRPTTAPGGQPLVAVNASGTGTTLIVDGATQALRANLRLQAADPDATPVDLAIVNDPATGLPAKLYVLDLLRETVMPVPLAGNAPYTRGAELPLAWSGQVRVPFTSAMTPAENGEWMFRNVAALGGSAAAPNSVSCNSCHMDGASDNSTLHMVEAPGQMSLQAGRDAAVRWSAHGTRRPEGVRASAEVPIDVPIQVPAPWGAWDTAPFFWDGSVPTIQRLVTGAQVLHNHTGKPPPAGSPGMLLDFLAAHQAPPSIYLNADGSRSADQLAGKALFEGKARCTQCHAGSSFLPPPGSPLTIAGGIGTGLAPANVPSLRGLWATAPYLSQGQARTLMEVFTLNPADAHGQATAGMTNKERKQLVAYLLTL